MITLFLITLAVVGIVFAMLPVIAFALMLETCVERTGGSARGKTTVDAAPVSPGFRLASAGY